MAPRSSSSSSHSSLASPTAATTPSSHTKPNVTNPHQAFFDLQHAAEVMGCSNCHARQPQLSTCSSCLSAVYCDKICQQQHWFSGHRYECGALAHAGFFNFMLALEHQQQQQQKQQKTRGRRGAAPSPSSSSFVDVTVTCEQRNQEACHAKKECEKEEEEEGCTSSSFSPPSSPHTLSSNKKENDSDSTTSTVTSSSKAVDAWLQEMGKAVVAITTTHTTSSSTPSSPMPAPGLDGLRTLCILAKSSALHLQQEHKKNSKTHTHTKEGDHDSLAARIYLQTLAVRGQLALHPPAYTHTQTQTRTQAQKLSAPPVTTHKLKQETAVKKITEALSKHKAAAKHIPNWTMRLLLVVGSLLRQLGKTHEAVAFLESHMYELVVGKKEERDKGTGCDESENENEENGSVRASNLTKAYLLLQYSQWMYFDQCAWLGASSPAVCEEARVKAEKVCRLAVNLLLKEEEEDQKRRRMSPSSPFSLHALLATATFRLADLLLHKQSSSSSPSLTQQHEALLLLRISLQHAPSRHFPTLRIYLASCLHALKEGNTHTATQEIEREKARRAAAEETTTTGGSGACVGDKAAIAALASGLSSFSYSSSSLLNLHGLEMWHLGPASWRHAKSDPEKKQEEKLRLREYQQQKRWRRRHAAMVEGGEGEGECDSGSDQENNDTTRTHTLTPRRRRRCNSVVAIPTTEEGEGEEEGAHMEEQEDDEESMGMDVCDGDEEEGDSTSTSAPLSPSSFSSAFSFTGSSSFLSATSSTSSPRRTTSHSISSSNNSSPVSRSTSSSLPPSKRRKSYYPFFQQITSCVTLPQWVAVSK